MRRFCRLSYLLLPVITVAAALLCICAGSVNIPLDETLRILAGKGAEKASHITILLNVRVPRVLCTALIGALLSLCGCAMQGLLCNPLADGATLGVSSGASLGAACAILLGFSGGIGGVFSGTTLLAMLFAFASLSLVLFLAWRLDSTLSTDSIVLIGVVFSMFISALMSLLVLFAGNKLRTITFWTMGSLASVGYGDAKVLAAALAVGFVVLLGCARSLNAFALGESRALHLGVNVRRVKLIVMIVASALVGVCVSIAGCIGFVGLITPHLARFVTGPDHRRLMPMCLFGGASFLMLADLVGRTILSPIELPIGVVTSLVGAVVFIVIFVRSRRKNAC